MRRAPVPGDVSNLSTVIAAIAVIATLYFARVVLIPLALALLFSLLLTPVVGFLEKMRLPRVLAIFLVVVILFGAIGLMVRQTSQQFIDLTSQLPTYRKTLQDKIHTLKGSSGQSFNKASDTVKELEKELVAATPGSSLANETRKTPATAGSSPSRPLTVEVAPPTNPLESVENIFGPLATAGVVLIFTVFMLSGREDLRNRLIRLAGVGRLKVITQALDETTHRIHRYLFLQLVVNVGYGAVIGTALHFIGIPNASLWGVTAAILRFLPYVGPPMAALVPVVLSLAVFPGWHHALETVGLFLVLELVVANFIEPVLYGAHVGLSALAILVAAVFWTLIWGFPGLVLSTPLTVCLAVVGRYFPNLSFLNVLLGDEPVLSPQDQYYQRLLATDQNEARQVLEEYLKDKTLEELYSSVVIPALSLAEQDRHRNELDEETQNFIYQSTREIAEELADISPGRDKDGMAGSTHVLCIPARDVADDVAAMLLAQLLESQGQRAESIPIGTTAEMLSQVADANPDVVCISALPPFALSHARALYTNLRARSPELHIVICLWNFQGDPEKTAHRLKLAAGQVFFTTLPQVLQHIAFRAEAMTSGTKQP